MISQVPPCLWIHVFKGSIWGNRGFIKISALLLPLSIIFALQVSEIGPDTGFIFFAVVLTVSAWLLVSTPCKRSG